MCWLWDTTSSDKPCTIEIKNGEYIDVSESGFWGLSKNTISINLNNAIIGGASNAGRDALIDTLLNDAVNSNKPIIYIRNRVNEQVNRKFAGRWGSNCIVLDLNCNGKVIGEINLFNGLTLDIVQKYIIEIMSNYIYMDDNMKNFSLIWLDKIFKVLQMSVPKEKFTLLKLGDYTYEWLEQKYKDLLSKNAVTMSEVSDLGRIRGAYQTQMTMFFTFVNSIKASGLAGLLSGKLTLKQVFDQKKIVLINLSNAKRTESKILLDLFLKRLLVEETNNAQGCVCMFEDVDVEECAQNFIKLLRESHRKGGNGNVFFTEANISQWLVNSSGVTDHPANYCNSFFVFKHNNPAAIKHWSELSGATKKKEVTINKAPMASVRRLDPDSWTSFFFGNCMVDSGTSTREVDTYRVEEHEFNDLDDRSCIAILKMSEYTYTRKVQWS